MIAQISIGTVPLVSKTQLAIIKITIADKIKIMSFQSKEVYASRWLYIQANYLGL